MEDNFRFNIDLIKGVETSEGDRIVYGVASSETLDGDGDIVEASGLKKSAEWFLKHGIVDWDHKTESDNDPSCYIGRPLDIRWDENNVSHIKVKLFKGVKKADSVWEQIQSEDSKLGFSVGGKILGIKKSVDQDTGKTVRRITKVFMNHIAITPRPSNPDALATVTPYGMFMKSLSSTDENFDEIFEDVMTSETKKKEELMKMMTATGNPVQEGSGGVEQGAHTMSVESLEASPKNQENSKEKKKKKKKQTVNLNKQLSIDIEEDSITINTLEPEQIQDQELKKAQEEDKLSIVSGYMKLIKAMSDGDKEALNVDKFLIDNGLNRKGRRIIKRHLAKKIKELIDSDSLIKGTIPNTYENSYINASYGRRKVNGVVLGAQEDAEFMPVQEASTTTGKQMKNMFTDDQVDQIIEKELKDFTPDRLNRLDQRLSNIMKDEYYDNMSENLALERINNVRIMYGRNVYEKTEFNKLWKENKDNVLNIIRSYDEKVIKKVEKALESAMQYKSGNVVDKVLH